MCKHQGTYLYLSRMPRACSVNVGRLGKLSFRRGYYCYIGSAFGPGGIESRVNRHFRKDKPCHWHIDYLKDQINPVGAWYTSDVQKCEHQWASMLSGVDNFSAVRNFGCTDCRCDSHLFHSLSNPNDMLSELFRQSVDFLSCLPEN
jgi:Uri superfamily endonuclease